MFSREELLQSPEYWFEGEQDELFRQVSSYMKTAKINQTQLAKKLKVSKGYISQILNGEFNFTLKTIIEISLGIGVVPQIKYTPLQEIINEEKKTEITYPIISFQAPISNDALLQTETTTVSGGHSEIVKKPNANTVVSYDPKSFEHTNAA